MHSIDLILYSESLEQLKQLAVLSQAEPSFISQWLPSIVGISASIVALIVGLLSRVSAKELVQTSRSTAEAQIKSAEQVARCQLENSKEITISQIKANLVAASRKEWIENLRKHISELLSLMNKAHTDMHTTKMRSVEDGERMWYLKTYIELLLNPAEKEHNDFCIKQDDFMTFCLGGGDDIEKWASLKAEYLIAAKVILKLEWNKVKVFS